MALAKSIIKDSTKKEIEPVVLKNCREAKRNYEALPHRISTNSIMKRMPFCDVCMSLDFKSKSTHICVQCQKLFCNGCTKKHEEEKSFHFHSIFSFEGLEGVTLQCSEHPDENVVLYCATCKHAICVICALRVHDNHDKYNFKDYLHQQRESIVELMNRAETNQRKGFLLAKHIEDEINKNDDEMNAISIEITRHYDMLMRSLELRKRTLLQEVKQTCSEKQTELQQNLESIKGQMYLTADHCDMAQSLLLSDMKIIKVNPKFLSSFEENIEIEYYDTFSFPETVKPLRFVPSYDINLGTLANRESLQVNAKEHRQITFDREQPLKISVDNSSENGSTHNDSGVSTNHNSEFTSPRDLASINSPCSSNASQYDNKKFSFNEELGASLENLIITEEAEEEEDNDSEEEITPCATPTNSYENKNTKFVQDFKPGEPRQIFKINYNNVPAVDPTGYNRYQTVPIDVAFKNEHKIVVTQWGIKPKSNFKCSYPPKYYQIRDGMVLYSFCNGTPMTEKCFQTCSPWCVSVHNGKYYITENRNTQRTIHKYLDNADIVGTWPTHKLTHPRGLAITKDKKFLVTDISNKQLRVFEENKENHPKLVMRLGEPGHYSWAGRTFHMTGSIYNEDDLPHRENVLFHDPQFVTTNSRGWMIISDTADHQIKIFNSNGLKLFNINGINDKDYLLSPMGVTTDNDDNIYIADYGNNRVVKFNRDGDFTSTVFCSQYGGVYQPRGLACYNNLLAVSCNNQLGNSEVKIFDMGIQLHKQNTAFPCPCDWLQACNGDDISKL